MSKLLMKSFAELVEKGNTDLAKTYYPHTCYRCGVGIQFYKAEIKHFNKAQDPPVKFFCSKSCRDSWVLEVRNNYDPALNNLTKK